VVVAVIVIVAGPVIVAVQRARERHRGRDRDVMKVGGLVDDEQYAHGIELLERVVSMLTKLIDP
jgi:hypothetical protein